MISVCMATYNGEKYIKQQLDSILAQLGENDEVIISDDGSTDKTVQIIENYNNNRIKLLFHQKNAELLKMPAASFRLSANNFENALNHAQGDFIHFSDQDDIWLPNRVKKMQAELEKYDLVMCNFKVIDDDDNVKNEKFYTADPVNKSLLANMLKTPFLGCCMAFRRDVLRYCMPFPKACIGHDYWMGCLIVRLGSFKFVEEPLHLYRKHSNNVSPATGKSKNPLWFKIMYRIRFFFQIISYSNRYKKRQKINESLLY